MSNEQEILIARDPLPLIKHPKVEDFDEKEEATKIIKTTLLIASNTKRYVLVPLLALCTAFIFLLVLQWSRKARKSMLYSETDEINSATHILIEGKDGNTEIVSLRRIH